MVLETVSVATGFFLIAVLYSMVGYGGGSGYLAVMALAGFAPETIRPTSLTLNVIVSSVALIRFAGVAGFRWRLFASFAAASVPAAFLAGWLLELDPTTYRGLVGALLLYAAYRLMGSRPQDAEDIRPLPLPTAWACGVAIGLISGLLGVGGGIFLGPLVLLMRWARAKETAGVVAAFVQVNSMAGLSGIGLSRWSSTASFTLLEPLHLALWGIAVLGGAFIGSTIGSRRLGDVGLRRVLALVLVTAAIRLLLH